MTDYIVFFSAFAIIIGGGIGLYLVYGSIKDYWGFVFVGIAFLSLVRAIVRLIYIFKMFKIGIEVEAKIVKVFFYRSRATLKFDYTFESASYSNSNFLLRNSKSIKLSAGTQVSVLVDPSKPMKALIVSVYQATSNNL